jgi:hypothetical protein
VRSGRDRPVSVTASGNGVNLALSGFAGGSLVARPTFVIWRRSDFAWNAKAEFGSPGDVK